MDCATKGITAREEGQIPRGIKHWVAGTQTQSQTGSPLHQRDPPATRNMASWGSNLGLPEHSIKEKHCSHGELFQGGCKASASVRQPSGAAGVRGSVLGTSVMDLHMPDNVTGSDPAQNAEFK